LNRNLVISSTVLLSLTALANAGTLSIAVGTPANSQLSPPSSPSPSLKGITINFDSLIAFATFPTFASNGVTIASPDGLEVLPFSTQSGPMELFDNSATGTANILINYALGTNAIGVGIADSDPVSVTFQALDKNGIAIGSFTENLAATGSPVNTGNGYYVIQDTTPDIFSLRITQSSGNPSFSGLAIDDVQVATPEPGTLLLLCAGAAVIGFSRRGRRV
jgi:hypothetical protein